MIVLFPDLPKFRKKVALVDGAFDPLHAGHIAYFQAALKLGLPLLVNIAPDSYTGRKHKIFIPASQRAIILDALKPITYVHVSQVTTAEVLQQLQPSYYVKGKDWENKLPEQEVQICSDLKIKIRYLDTILDSSSEVLKRFSNQEK